MQKYIYFNDEMINRCIQRRYQEHFVIFSAIGDIVMLAARINAYTKYFREFKANYSWIQKLFWWNRF